MTLSPIYDSISKQGYKAAFSESEMKKACEKGIIDHQVIALGGIDSSHILHLTNMGFGGIAVLGMIHKDLHSILTELTLLYKLKQ